MTSTAGDARGRFHVVDKRPALSHALSLANAGILTTVAGILVFITWFAILFTDVNHHRILPWVC